MSQVKKHIKVGLTLLIAAIFALNCGRGNTQTQFSKNMDAEAGQAAPTYEQWVALIGQDKTDQLFAGIGQDSLNILSYGIGVSNMVQFINAVTSTPKLIMVIGNDFIAGTGPGAKSGLGTLVTLNLIKTVDTQMQTAVTANLPAPCGGLTPLACGDNDTIANLADVINTLTVVEVQQKLIDLFGPAGFALTRNMSGANDVVYVGRMAKVVAHVNTATALCNTKLCPLLQGLTAAEVTGKLAPLMMYNTAAGIVWANKLVETIETTTLIANLITVIQNVTVANITLKMAPIIDTVTDCTKMGYTINNVTALTTVLVPIINNVANPVRLGTLINKIEDAASYTAIQGTLAPNNWHGGSQAWGTPVKAAPHGTLGAGGAISITIAGGVATTFSAITAGAGYHPDLTYSNVFAGCGTQPTLHLALVGGALDTTATNHKVGNPGAGCTNGTFVLTLVDSVASTGMARLVRMINYLTPANYFEMLNLIDTISNMDKLVVTVQDPIVIDDLTQMLNGMAPATTGAGCTGAVTFGGPGAGATATAFVTAGAVGYVTVTAGGAGYTAASTATLTGCAGVATTLVQSGGVVTGIYVNLLPVNSMAEMVENISTANVPRLVEVINGERIWDNTGTQTSAVGGPPAAAPTASTYLGKMVTLIGGLNQTQEGPIKVTQMINGVTNTDKIIDLIYGVTATTNLSQIINGIFSASLGLGCSDSSASAYVTSGTCDAGASTAGNGFVWGMRNQSVNTMVYVLQNVTNTQNLIGLINGSTPTQVSDLINHVASSGNGAATFNGLNSTQVEDPASASCGTCSGALANTSLYSGAGMRMTKVIDFSAAAAYPYDLAFLLNKTSTIKVAKLIIAMSIGQTATGSMGPMTNGTGKVGDLMTRITSTPASAAGVASAGNCFQAASAIPASQSSPISVNITGAGAGYTAAPVVTFACDATVVAVATINAGGNINGIYITNTGAAGTCAASAAATINPALGGAAATANVGHCITSRGLAQTAVSGFGPIINIGKGKLVNMVNYISGASDTAAMGQLAYVLNNINNAQKLGDLVNKIQRSSNVVALMNGVIDANNNTSTTDLVNLMNNLPLEQLHKLTGLIQQLNPAIETATDTLAGMDQDLVAQLMAPFVANAAPYSAVITMTSANPGVVSWAGNTLAVGREVVFSTTGTLPTALNAGQVYFVAPAGFVAGTSFQLALTPGGASINTTAGAQAGVHTGLANEPTAVSGVGTARMNELLGSLTSTPGSGFAAAPAISFGAGCTTVPTATANIAVGVVTNVTLTTAGDCTTGAIAISPVGPSPTATFGFVAMPKVAYAPAAASGANANVTVKSVYIKDGGSGYGAPPAITFPTCVAGTTPAATATISGLSSIDVTTAGACTSNPTVTITPANGASATALVAGTLNAGSITNLYGGTGYTAGHNCPITGAGGSGGICNGVTVAAGAVTGCTTVTGGNDYLSSQTVTIGGAAKFHALVNAAGTMTGYVMDSAGCGYLAAPTITVQGCTGVVPVPGAATITSGGITAIALGTAGTLCPPNPRVIITGAHGDGATFTVGTLASGYLALVTLSTGANNLAQTLANQEKAPLGAAVTYGNSAPNIGAREAFVRLLWLGTSYNGGNFPGVGPAHLAYNVMSQLGSATSVETVINMMNSDTTSMADLDVLIGCADGVEFGNGIVGAATSNDFEAICRANAYW